MIRITISPAAFEAIAKTLPLGSVGYENKTNERGERLIWLDRAVVGRLSQGHARPGRELQRRDHQAGEGDLIGVRGRLRRARPCAGRLAPNRIYKPQRGLHDISVLSKSCYGPSLSGNKAVIGGMSPNGST
jgi:hypothetical protein